MCSLHSTHEQHIVVVDSSYSLYSRIAASLQCLDDLGLMRDCSVQLRDLLSLHQRFLLCHLQLLIEDLQYASHPKTDQWLQLQRCGQRQRERDRELQRCGQSLAPASAAHLASHLDRAYEIRQQRRDVQRADLLNVLCNPRTRLRCRGAVLVVREMQRDVCC